MKTEYCGGSRSTIAGSGVWCGTSQFFQQLAASITQSAQPGPISLRRDVTRIDNALEFRPPNETPMNFPLLGAKPGEYVVECGKSRASYLPAILFVVVEHP